MAGMKVVRYCLGAVMFCLLTALTQIGGLIFLVSLPTYRYVNRLTGKTGYRILLKTASFAGLYCLATLLIVPAVAKPLGRVPLPLAAGGLRPLNILTCVCNRHYVRPQLRDAVLAAAKEMEERYPGTTVNYLDACFPFIDGFPLLPHLSHDDGKKMDLAFYYTDRETATRTNRTPSLLGYGIFEGPRPGEMNMPEICRARGYGKYGILGKFARQGRKSKFEFDPQRTKVLVEQLAGEEAIGKIFIEPHLKARMNISSAKVAFHGCGAVRHDDHIHIQLK